MAFTNISSIVSHFPKARYANWWLKAYEPGTTNPKVMASDATGIPTVAKYEVNSEGFFKTSGGAKVIPFIDGPFDLWLFPTEADADANDTTNAEQFADNITASLLPDQSGKLGYHLTAESSGAAWTAVDMKVAATESVMVNDPQAVSGQVWICQERGDAMFDVVPTSSLVPNIFDALIGVANPLISFKLRNAEPIKTTHLGIPNDLTDQTALMSSYFTSISPLLRATYEIAPNTSFDRKTIIGTLPQGVAILDNSSYDYNSGGETTKKYGIMERGSATGAFDMSWSIESGHHAVMSLNNYGNAGSVSGAERKATIIWTVGNYTTQGENKRGYRNAAMQQFTKDSGSDIWHWSMHSLAPWVAIDAEYELWKSSESVTIGDYRYTGNNHYVAATTGTTGGSIPTHLSGTVSDGGVDWTFVDSADRTVFLVTEHGRLQFGIGAVTDVFNFIPGFSDPGLGICSANFSARPGSIGKNVQVKLNPTDSAGNESLQPYLLARDNIGLEIRRSDNTKSIAYFNDDLGTRVNEFALSSSTAGNLDATPSVDGVGTLYLSNTGSTNVTILDDGDDDQIVRLVSTNSGNTVLVHSTSFRLQGSINSSLNTFDSITMQKAPSSISSAWFEVGRSIK